MIRTTKIEENSEQKKMSQG